MAEISFDAVLDAATLRLRELYPDAGIFAEDVPQDLDPPAFLVRTLTSSHAHEIGQWYPGNGMVPQGSRYKRNALLEVTYFPESNPGRRECERVKEQLLWGLEHVRTPAGDVLGARDMNATISDDVLLLTLRYPHFVITDQPQQTMQQLAINGLEEING